MIPLTFLLQVSYGPGMRTIALPILSTLLGLFQSRALLLLEILALRQQLAMVNQAPRKRLRFHWGQRLFWIWLSLPKTLSMRIPAKMNTDSGRT
jgi:hypothetical protein